MAQWRAVVELPGTLRAARMGRRIVAAALEAWERPELIDDALVVTSELITNAVQHAAGSETYELEVLQHGDGVRIYLADGSTIRPIIRQLDNDTIRGRGMQLVQTLAASWGVDDHHGGKRVWVDLAGPGPIPDDPERRAEPGQGTGGQFD